MRIEDVKPGLRVRVLRHGEPYRDGVLDGHTLGDRWANVRYVREPGEQEMAWSTDLDNIEPIEPTT